jgi:heme/copper-type cytochrome/quinol oxidase subunit 2
MIYWWLEFLAVVVIVGVVSAISMPVVRRGRKTRQDREWEGSGNLMTWQLGVFILILAGCLAIGVVAYSCTETRTPWN